MESLSDLIDGMLAEPNSESEYSPLLPKDKWLDRWHWEFWKPFLPGTRVKYKQISGVIVDHTDSKLKPQPNDPFRYNQYRKEKTVFILFDNNNYNDGCYQPYWLCFLSEIRLEDENSNII